MCVCVFTCMHACTDIVSICSHSTGPPGRVSPQHCPQGRPWQSRSVDSGPLPASTTVGTDPPTKQEQVVFPHLLQWAVAALPCCPHSHKAERSVRTRQGADVEPWDPSCPLDLLGTYPKCTVSIRCLTGLVGVMMSCSWWAAPVISSLGAPFSAWFLLSSITSGAGFYLKKFFKFFFLFISLKFKIYLYYFLMSYFLKLINYYFFVTAPHSMQNLSSPTRNWNVHTHPRSLPHPSLPSPHLPTPPPALGAWSFTTELPGKSRSWSLFCSVF